MLESKDVQEGNLGLLSISHPPAKYGENKPIILPGRSSAPKYSLFFIASPSLMSRFALPSKPANGFVGETCSPSLII